MPRGNVNNLRTPTSEEAREIGRKGGIRSGQVRKERKTMAEQLKIMLAEGDTQVTMLKAVIDKAFEGDVKAVAFVRDTIGENPTIKQEITGSIPVVIDGGEKLKD